jgi:membrane-bound lytic murein transglycosylase D
LDAASVETEASVVGNDAATDDDNSETIAQDNETEINNAAALNDAIDDPEKNKQILSESVSVAKAEPETAVPETTVALLESGMPATTEPTADMPIVEALPNAVSSDADTSEVKAAPVEDAPPTEASELDQEATQPVAQDDVTTEEMAADPSDYSVADNHTIEVQAAETLGHYAEWLGLRASQLRRINRMRYGKPVVIGKRIKLDFSRVTHDEFERQRIEYHRVLQETFFEQFQITGKDEYKIRRGDSIWVLAKRKYKIPIWLLRQYNPDLQLQKLTPGVIVTFPRVEQRSEPVAEKSDGAADQPQATTTESIISKR